MFVRCIYDLYVVSSHFHCCSVFNCMNIAWFIYPVCYWWTFGSFAVLGYYKKGFAIPLAVKQDLVAREDSQDPKSECLQVSSLLQEKDLLWQSSKVRICVTDDSKGYRGTRRRLKLSSLCKDHTGHTPFLHSGINVCMEHFRIREHELESQLLFTFYWSSRRIPAP